ncbi:conserved hypothetical protein [Ricinus communis]|uniref:Uncharacterized protein n=1 Tax=Ricinus communis TaxID=3988 RepID=B9RQ21_RICCO|nr:conserved hypothetical protein [Ricinus communis]
MECLMDVMIRSWKPKHKVSVKVWDEGKYGHTFRHCPKDNDEGSIRQGFDYGESLQTSPFRRYRQVKVNSVDGRDTTVKKLVFKSDSMEASPLKYRL